MFVFSVSLVYLHVWCYSLCVSVICFLVKSCFTLRVTFQCNILVLIPTAVPFPAPHPHWFQLCCFHLCCLLWLSFCHALESFYCILFKLNVGYLMCTLNLMGSQYSWVRNSVTYEKPSSDNLQIFQDFV